MTKKTESSVPPLTEEATPLSLLSIPTAVAVPFGDPNTIRYAVGLNATKGGLKVFVERYQRMLLGDYIEVFWNGSAVPAVNTTVDQYNIDTRIGLNIPESEIKAGRITPFYRVTAISSSSDTSPSRDIWVKLDIPGGANPEPGKQENKNLAAPIVPADVAQSGVDKPRAQSGVEITIPPYPNMAEYDRIEFWWGGQRKWILVQPDQVGQPVRFTVDEQTILTAGDGEIILRYQLIDAALNFSDGWSLSTKIKVTASNTQLAAPLVDEAVDGVLELAVLSGRDAHVQILAINSPFAKGDTIEVLWEGRSADGTEVNHKASLVLQSASSVPHVPIPYEKVAAIAQGAAVVSYILRKADGTELASLRTQVSIRGKAFSLLAPLVVEANAGLLNHTLSSATVRILPYASMARGNEVTLIWVGQRADGQATYYHDSVILTESAVGRDVLFQVPGTEIAALTGGTLEVYYLVKTTLATEVPAQQSAHLQLQVTGNVTLLPAPTVPEANGENLDPALPYANALVPAYPGIRIGDNVQLLWIGDLTGLYQDHQTVETPAQLASGLSLRVYGENILGNLDNYVTVFYIVTRDGKQVGKSASLRLHIGAAQAALPAPRVDQAQGNIIITADVSTSGASVRIPASARLITGDTGTVRWRGQAGSGTIDVPFTVWQSDQDVVVTIPHAVVAANNGFTVIVDYTVNRGAQTSPSASYDVRATSRNGRLLVMGARSLTDRNRNLKSVSTLIGQSSLTALDSRSHQPVQAIWRYASQAEVEAKIGSRFVDTRPTEILEVRALEDKVQIRPRNLTGNGLIHWAQNTVAAAFAAQRDTGTLMAWGDQAVGGAFPLNSAVPGLLDITEVVGNDMAFAAIRKTGQVVVWGDVGHGGSFGNNSIIAGLTDIVEVVPSRFAFTARRRGGQIVTWGNAGYGGAIPAGSGISSLTDIVDVVGNRSAFAALRSNGQVVAWGYAGNGGLIPVDSGISSLTDIVQVIASEEAFAALRSNGQVVAWGHVGDGGYIPPNSGISSLTDIVEVNAASTAFTARRSNGQVVSWGNQYFGGIIPPDSGISGLTDIVKVVPAWAAFAAQRSNGQVVVWGDVNSGGSFLGNSGIAGLTDVVEVVSNLYAFAARRANGQVVAWGKVDSGGSFPNGSVIAGLTDIIQVVPNGYAFAALRANGTVVAWGNTACGGLIPANIATQLTDVRAIYANSTAFVALTSDNRLVSWGYAPSGGDNAPTPASLRGSLSYEINSAT